MRRKFIRQREVEKERKCKEQIDSIKFNKKREIAAKSFKNLKLLKVNLKLVIKHKD